ncbi:hypothetical protein B0H11DRAFT_2202156 [Mycena galericulata]|nr:hypothetical protein B0H11DRAFT_2202156 [Mycena galericulata]
MYPQWLKIHILLTARNSSGLRILARGRSVTKEKMANCSGYELFFGLCDVTGLNPTGSFILLVCDSGPRLVVKLHIHQIAVVEVAGLRKKSGGTRLSIESRKSVGRSAAGLQSPTIGNHAPSRPLASSDPTLGLELWPLGLNGEWFAVSWMEVPCDGYDFARAAGMTVYARGATGLTWTCDCNRGLAHFLPFPLLSFSTIFQTERVQRMRMKLNADHRSVFFQPASVCAREYLGICIKEEVDDGKRGTGTDDVPSRPWMHAPEFTECIGRLAAWPPRKHRPT